MRCPACDADNSELARFCASCGGRLTVVCGHCRAAVSLDARFCTSCGGTMPPIRAPDEIDKPRRTPGSERRRVSVLFADLENFTSLAESLDPEEVRAIQSRYFEVARSAIAVFGGTIEKFIGDAIVAVWGAPTAHEDDAERAVRAALEIVSAVPRLGAATAGRSLVARAAVATGEAAVTMGAEGQGMVSGDVINTAARLQTSAPSGAVLVDEGTRQASGLDAGITFASLGALHLKGKSLPIAAFGAVLGEPRRGGRGAGHAGAFIARSGELRELVGIFDAAVRERRGRMASVLGIAGIGKSRLVWELEREVEARPAHVEWHTGRAPAYGEGIAFAAVAEMVRRRCRINDRAEAEVGRRQLASTLAELVRDRDERSWMEPRLAVLLDPTAPREFEREELFAAWRRFFERVSEQAPTVLVFGDLQWADAGLLDFIEHLGTWSRDHPILIVTLARLELLDVRPTWGAAQRAFTTLRLDRLPDTAIRELLEGRAHGIPRTALRHILDRAGGVPLYAVALVRMLIDRGQLLRADGDRRLSGPLVGSNLPDSLHGILAARIDALPPPERSLLMSAAVLGHRFPPDALAAVSGLHGPELRVRLVSLVQRELLAYDDELRSPGRGQIEFVQDLVRELAYRTLSRSERQAAHLAAAHHFEAIGDEELVESTAAHLAAAFAADPAHPEAESIAERARALLREAAGRALALHAPERALIGLERALEMAADDEQRRALLEDAATAARLAGRLDIAEGHIRELMRLSAADEPSTDRDRLRAQLASVLLMAHHNAAALDELESAIVATEEQNAQPATAELIGQLARAKLLVGQDELAVEWADRALLAARRHGLTAIAVDALVTRGTGRFRSGSEEAGRADLRAAIDRAHAGGLLTTELRARNNLAWLAVSDDPRLTFQVARDGGDLAARMGVVDWAVQMAELGCLAAIDTGDWDWALAMFERFEEEPIPAAYRIDLAASVSVIHLLRGDHRPLAAIDALEPIDPSTDPQDVASIDHAHAWDALLRSDLSAASALADRAAAASLGAEQHRDYVLAARARLWAEDLPGLREAIGVIEGMRMNGRAADAAQLTLDAGAAALGGEAGASAAYEAAAERWRDLDLPLHLALCLVEWHRFAGGDAPDHASALLNRLGASGLAAAVRSLPAPRTLSAAAGPPPA